MNWPSGEPLRSPLRFLFIKICSFVMVLVPYCHLRITGENMHYGTPTNPQMPSCIPGGSSSGSAVAVAVEIVDFALGMLVIFRVANAEFSLSPCKLVNIQFG